MTTVIDDILRENTAYYRRTKTMLVGRLLVNERGSLIRKQINGKTYNYLRKVHNGKRRDLYLGPESSLHMQRVQKSIEQSKSNLIELRRAKDALKKLRAKNMDHEDFTGRIKELFQLMDHEGLWDEGLQLVGSWCFKVYQNYLGVEHYPIRTVDVDFAIKIPYRGTPVKIGEKLREMGFQEDRNRKDGSIAYLAGDISIEFLKHRMGDGKSEGDTYIRELDIAPQPVPYLKILLDHPRTYRFRDLGKITVPSMPAFLAHKLAVSSKRRDPAKKEKDLRQALAVARAVLQDPELVEEFHTVVSGLHKSQQKMISKLAQSSDKFVPGSSRTFGEILC
ncbi:MAG: nucleotidyltransferase domain-containing protein [Desulfohalobiaceae bacterium]|nr:nucleotidyltransferase domain-containing protein [Desulfohalobiaceae bacterium]